MVAKLFKGWVFENRSRDGEGMAYNLREVISGVCIGAAGGLYIFDAEPSF